MCEVTFSNEEALQVHLTDDHNAIVLVEGDAQSECTFCLLVVKGVGPKNSNYNGTCNGLLVCKREVTAQRDSCLGNLLLHN